MIDMETRPYPNEHAARVRDPDDFARIVQLKKLDNGIRILGGPLKDDEKGNSRTQAYRFPKDKFTVAEARKWLKDNAVKYIYVEPAAEKSAEDDVERRTADYEIRAEETTGDDEKPVKHLIGYAAMFGKRTTIFPGMDEIVAPGAFSASLKKGDDVRALFNHSPDMVLGRSKAGTLTLEEDDKGLRYDITLPDTQIAEDLYTLVNRGDVSGSSFAFRCTKDEWDKSDPKCALRTLKEVKLFDVSPVTYPAYPQTKVSARALDERLTVIDGCNEAVPRGSRRNRLSVLQAMLGTYRPQAEQK